MKQRSIIAFILLILLTTISFQNKIIISKFNIEKINIQNISYLKETDIKNSLNSIYGKNLLFLDNKEIEKTLINNSLINSFIIKKKYPDTIIIKIFEKKPIAILFNKKKKFYLSEEIDLIEFKNYKSDQILPHVFGNKEEFKIFYLNLKKIKFPVESVKSYTLYETNRWDIETKNRRIIKLPAKNYNESVENFIKFQNEKQFKQFKVFDFRIPNQLILK